jgi:hypothetical protein
MEGLLETNIHGRLVGGDKRMAPVPYPEVPKLQTKRAQHGARRFSIAHKGDERRGLGRRRPSATLSLGPCSLSRRSPPKHLR